MPPTRPSAKAPATSRAAGDPSAWTNSVGDASAPPTASAVTATGKDDLIQPEKTSGGGAGVCGDGGGEQG